MPASTCGPAVADYDPPSFPRSKVQTNVQPESQLFRSFDRAAVLGEALCRSASASRSIATRRVTVYGSGFMGPETMAFTQTVNPFRCRSDVLVRPEFRACQIPARTCGIPNSISSST